MADIRLEFEQAVMSEVPNPAEYLNDIATAVEAKWKELASQKLHTTRKDYVNAIVKRPVVAVGDKISVTIELTANESPGSWLPNMLEQGFAPFDMKQTLLSRGDSQVIFMRKGTPTAVNLQRMTPQQHSIMRNLKTDKPPMDSMRSGSKSASRQSYGVHYTSSPFRSVSTAAGTPYVHKDHIYQKMQKMVNKSSVTYGTFRTISKKSDPASWHHPGRVPLNLAEQVVEDMGL